MEGVLLPQRTDPSSKDRGVWLCGRHRDLKTWGGVREVENTHLRTRPPTPNFSVHRYALYQPIRDFSALKNSPSQSLFMPLLLEFQTSQ